MAITVFTGPPGAGKSHALVKDVILPALKAGRRVLSNIDGLNPDAIRAHCLERMSDATRLGDLVLFDGEQAKGPGFWPDDKTPDTQTFVKGGDLIVFDEWKLYFDSRGKWPPGCNVEPFLRWHRHLNGPDGTATDIAIGTQLATDVHLNVRGLIVKSYKFRKLTGLGMAGQYTWKLWDGHQQTKGGHYKEGTASYDKAIFPLYASSAAAKEGTHVELRTNRKETIWSGWKPWAVIGGAPIFMIGGMWMLWDVYQGFQPQTNAAAVEGPAPVPGAPVAVSASPAPAPSPWRIVGQIDGESGRQVVVIDDSGAVRTLPPTDFEFGPDGRAISGVIEGKLAVASDSFPGEQSSMLATAFAQ